MNSFEIPLSRGLVARVSPDDYERLAQHRWHAVAARSTFYAARRTPARTVYMHRDVLGVVALGREVFVDHINHDGLDNTRENLRQCTHAENARNRRSRIGTAPEWAIQRAGDKWRATISAFGSNLRLGTFDSEHEALIAYSAAEKTIAAAQKRRGV